MVRLVVNNMDQISMLEDMLKRNDIVYEVVDSTVYSSFVRPFLIVDGVPLDMGRALKWIGGKKK